MSTVQNRRSQINQNPATRGGQHHIGLFGVPGATGRPRVPATSLPALAKQSAPAQRMAARREAALAGASQLDRLTAFFAKKDAARAQEPVPAAPVAPAAPLALTLRITRERLAVFATLATIEQRPLEEVIDECLADMAAHLTRSRHRLHLDPEDQAKLDAYLDGLAARQERAEWEQEDAAARAATTPAMRAVAHAADMREAFPHFHDDEEGERLHRFSGAGYVETQLAHD